MPMMTPSGGGFPWLVVVVPAAILLLLIVALVVLRLGAGNGRSSTRNAAEQTPHPDPIAILRERLAQGDIDLPEFERRVEGLLRSDPAERTTWIASTSGPGSDGERTAGATTDLGAP